MDVAYIDTSYLAAIIYQQADWRTYRSALSESTTLVSSLLLESELLSVGKREGTDLALLAQACQTVNILFPRQSLRTQIERVLDCGYLRGPDLHHLAVALWFASGNESSIRFLSLDLAQAAVAKNLGFLGY